MTPRKLLPVALILFTSVRAESQRPPEYDRVVVVQSRIDARDLGYPPVDVIPDGESGITSLTVAPNQNLYGATSGTRSHLFLLNPRHGYVEPMGVIPGTTAVTNAVVVAASGNVYIGTFPQGHLLKYISHDEDHQPIRVREPLLVTDLGMPVKGESIYALAIDRRARTIYGLTSPNAHFFRFSIATGKFADLGVVALKIPPGEKFETQKIMSRMLVVDPNGNVFASGEDGYLFRYDSQTQTLSRLHIRAPAVPGREPWNLVDAFLLDPSGMIFGGTSDGYLFRLDPKALTITDLGKPLNQYRIAGLVHGPGNKLYGVGGDDQEMARLFSYDTYTAAYDLLGFVDVNRRPYYTWQAYVIGALASDAYGTVYIGENERISRLYLFYPWP